jgi:predicted DNA-binding antitoxin AbrB/MazE fold protein
MRFIHAQYEEGSLKPKEHLPLRHGEWVNLVVVRQPDPKRWDLGRLAAAPEAEEQALTEEGLGDWVSSLEAEDRA